MSSCLSFGQKLMLEKNLGRVICYGQSIEKVPFYVIIEAPRQNIEQMHHDYALRKAVNFSEYGTILYFSHTAEPMPEILMAFGFPLTQ